MAPFLRAYRIAPVIVAAVIAAIAVTSIVRNVPEEVVGTRDVAPMPSTAQPVLVREVVSGDTVLLSVVNRGPQVLEWGLLSAHLFGIDAPSVALSECYGEQAASRLSELLPVGSVVWVAKQAADPGSANGGFFIWLSDGRLVNYLVAAGGYVYVVDGTHRDPWMPAIKGAESRASTWDAGLWGACD